MTSQQLVQSQQQKLQMTTSLSQSINILQMTAIDIAQLINQAVEQNPLLELVDSNSNIIEIETIAGDYDDNDDMNHINVINHHGDHGDISSHLSEKVTLKQHILEQIYINIRNNHDKVIAFHLTDSLNENGYLDVDIKHVAHGLNCSVARVEKVLSSLQTYDPAGVFATNLAECLKIQ